MCSPGTTLHDLLLDRFDLDMVQGCGCKQWIEKMNVWGPAGCREHLDEIVRKMLGEAERRKWKLGDKPLLSAVARVGTLTPWGMRFARSWARKLVTEAIERSEQNEKNELEVDVRHHDRTEP